MDIATIRDCVLAGRFLLSAHADQEAAQEDIAIASIRTAILHGEVIETYEDTGRGASCLILGFVAGIPIHIVCGWRSASVVVITVYIPKPPKFVDPWSRGR